MKVFVRLDAPEHHHRSFMPKALRDLFYNRHGDSLLGLISNMGSPHSGGQQKLTINGDRADVVAWLDMFLEQYPETKPEIDEIKKRIRIEFVHHGYKSSCTIELNRFIRQHAYKGEFIMRDWFWHPESEEASV